MNKIFLSLLGIFLTSSCTLIPSEKENEYENIQIKEAKEYIFPTIEILSQQNIENSEKEYLLEFTVNHSTYVFVNAEKLLEEDGKFKKNIELENLKTKINILVKNGDKEIRKKIIVERKETTEEEVKRLEKEKEEKIEMAKDSIREKKQQEEEKLWKSTKAGKICEKYPFWSKNDCEKIANNEIWIGMTYEMLIELRGLPNSANPSNYGYGTHWQWCWNNYSPSCFYDNDGDNIIDSYN